MFKALLLATAIAWPIVAIAQDAPKAPEAGKLPSIEQVLGRICIEPVNEKLVVNLEKDFSISLEFDTPLTEDGKGDFVRHTIFQSKHGDPEDKSMVVIEVATFISKDHKPIACVETIGGFDPDSLESKKKKWDTMTTSETPAPLTEAPKPGTVPTPKFQETNPDE